MGGVVGILRDSLKVIGDWRGYSRARGKSRKNEEKNDV
jgi:hypothetical protein